ncbi:EamA family transporter [Pseudodesulfovibrio sp. JC047]|uniref:DMT family transporter n=1 Tax=Pseudodesulfovibrio sp. JC047 TaxID=2683199 RepID=UPI0013D63E52|nr:DMT family transporter [Pseudodesulfovibrio sp. JC047]NDV19322.1 EamA family transporter [Pseudodesulfovibrio sp. JC047]
MMYGLLLSLISATAFAALPLLVKLGYAAGMDGAVMMQYRFSYAAFFVLLVILLKDRSLFRISRQGFVKCALLGVIVYWVQTTFFVKSLATIPASTASLILYGYPVIVTIASVIFLGMRLNKLVVCSLLLVVSGCCLVFYDAFLREVDHMGLLYAFGSTATFSAYLVLTQVLLKDLKALTATLYVLFFAAISFTVSGDITAWMHSTTEQHLIGLALGLIPGLVAISLLYAAIDKIGCAYASIFSSVEPVMTLAGAALLLDEQIVLLQIIGMSLILFGIVVPNLRFKHTVEMPSLTSATSDESENTE